VTKLKKKKFVDLKKGNIVMKYFFFNFGKILHPKKEEVISIST
jgi:hypothetical protein